MHCILISGRLEKKKSNKSTNKNIQTDVKTVTDLKFNQVK